MYRTNAMRVPTHPEKIIAPEIANTCPMVSWIACTSAFSILPRTISSVPSYVCSPSFARGSRFSTSHEQTSACELNTPRDHEQRKCVKLMYLKNPHDYSRLFFISEDFLPTLAASHSILLLLSKLSGCEFCKRVSLGLRS